MSHVLVDVAKKSSVTTCFPEQFTKEDKSRTKKSMTIVKVLIQSSRNDVLDFVLVLFAFELNEGSGTVQRLRFILSAPSFF